MALKAALMAEIAALKKKLAESSPEGKRLQLLESLLASEPNDDPVIVEGRPAKTPSGWKVADAIEDILENGEKSMREAELVRALVDGNFVRGANTEFAEDNAHRAISQGVNAHYLKRDHGWVSYVPGIRKPRVRKKH
jgi:hypothetical protein